MQEISPEKRKENIPRKGPEHKHHGRGKHSLPRGPKCLTMLIQEGAVKDTCKETAFGEIKQATQGLLLQSFDLEND